MSRTFCAPVTPQNMPDCLSLRPMTVLLVNDNYFFPLATIIICQ
jgi:hypothetical protein